jgi:hypothetical protein
LLKLLRSCYEWRSPSFKVRTILPTTLPLSADPGALNSTEYLPYGQTPTPGPTPTAGGFPTPNPDTARPSQSHFAEALGGWTPTATEDSSALDPSYKGQSSSIQPGTGLGISTPFQNREADYTKTTAGSLTVPSPRSNPAFTPRQEQGTTILASPGIPSYTSPKTLDHQLPSPPSTIVKSKGELAPALNMQDDQNFGQPAFLVTSQPQGLDTLLEGAGDIFDYPMSAPVTGPDSFWDDTGMSFNMDMSFVDTNSIDWSQPMTPSHRPSGSFDYNNEVNLFAPTQSSQPLQPSQPSQLAQPAQPAQPARSPAKAEPVRPAPPQRRERVLAPKPPAVDTSAGVGPSTISKPAGYHPNLAEPFSATNPGGQSGSLGGRPQTSTGEMSFQFTNEAGVVQNGPSEIGSQSSKTGSRRGTTARGAKNGKLPDRASASSPIKPSSARPGLGRSFSESRGRKSAVRSKMTTQPPTSRINPQILAAGSNSMTGQVALPSGRISPVKSFSQSSTLKSIPELAPRRAPASNVEFLIVNGRAEARLVKPPTREGSKSGGYSSESSDDSSDDEPIHLPNQVPSRNTSFALPDPLKPVGSIFNAMDDQDDIESEAETVMNDANGEKSDAISEIHRVLERQRQRKQGNGSAQSFQHRSRNSFYQDTASPDSLGSGMGGRTIRCVCSRTSAEKGAGYLIKWYVYVYHCG